MPELWGEIQLSPWEVDEYFPAGTLVTGKSGTGKSTYLRALEEKWADTPGNKVMDMLDFGRFELGTMSFPNNRRSMFERYKKRTIQQLEAKDHHTHEDKEARAVIDALEWTPKGYPVEIYVPATTDMPARLPSLFRPFRLNFHDITLPEFEILLGGGITESARSILSMAWINKEDSGKKYKINDLLTDVVELASTGHVRINKTLTRVADMRSVAPLLRNIISIQKHGVIGYPGDPYLIDLKRIMVDTKTITGFSYAFTRDMETSYLIIAYLIKRIHDMRLADAEHYPNLRLFFREIHKVAPVEIDYGGQVQSLKYLKLMASEPRDIKVWLLGDTQGIMKVNKTVRLAPHTYVCFQLSVADALAVNDMIGCPDTVRKSIINLGIGMYAHYNDGWNTPNVYIPPVSHIKAYDESFMDLWERLRGKDEDAYTVHTLPEAEKTLKIERVKDEGKNFGKTNITFFRSSGVLLYLKTFGGAWVLTTKIQKDCVLSVEEFKNLLELPYFTSRIERGRVGRKHFMRYRGGDLSWRSRDFREEYEGESETEPTPLPKKEKDIKDVIPWIK